MVFGVLSIFASGGRFELKKRKENRSRLDFLFSFALLEAFESVFSIIRHGSHVTKNMVKFAVFVFADTFLPPSSTVR